LPQTPWHATGSRCSIHIAEDLRCRHDSNREFCIF